MWNWLSCCETEFVCSEFWFNSQYYVIQKWKILFQFAPSRFSFTFSVARKMCLLCMWRTINKAQIHRTPPQVLENFFAVCGCILQLKGANDVWRPGTEKNRLVWYGLYVLLFLLLYMKSMCLISLSYGCKWHNSDATQSWNWIMYLWVIGIYKVECSRRLNSVKKKKEKRNQFYTNLFKVNINSNSASSDTNPAHRWGTKPCQSWFFTLKA